MLLRYIAIFTLFGAFTVKGYKDPNFSDNRSVITHLFEWKWTDIGNECERFLGPMGYGGVQVSPVQENVVVEGRPWWERYQPVSYLWITRSGNANEFKDMVRRCNKSGVRIYVDAIINHMARVITSVVGTGGSKATDMNYPAVPYYREHFHYPCPITNYFDPPNVRYCQLSNLQDLDDDQEYVKQKILRFMNEVIDAGVAGFRIDAAKHMKTENLKDIYSRLHDLNTEHGFPTGARPYIYQEVPDYSGTEAISKWEYNILGAVTEFKYGIELSNALKGNNLLKWMINWGEGWNMIPSKDALIFVDNHDTQRSNLPVTYKNSKLYKMASAFMLAHPYGTAKVMSSYAFNTFSDGPPADGNGNLMSAGINADDTCTNGWICEHRWRQIYNMVQFRNVVRGTNLENWWDNDKNQVAFCRGNQGFFAINNDNWDLEQELHTCLPAGNYCDVISGKLVDGKCTGKTIHVNDNGKAKIVIRTWEEDGVLAIHQGAKLR